MGIEIDFLPVGTESASGDAIGLRYGDLFGPRSAQTVVVIDGGFEDNGQQIVDHVRGYYGSDSVDIVISTHPDQDHVSGLITVLEQLAVGELWMHLPWSHSTEMASTKSAGFDRANLPEPLRKSLEGASTLESVATRLGIRIVEPFALEVNTIDNVLSVVGPTRAYYESLLGQIRFGGTSWVQKAVGALRRLVAEAVGMETLTDSGEVSPQNNSSVVCFIEHEGYRALLTSDAGIPALTAVADLLDNAGVQTGSFNVVQVPHHGSRRNVGPTVLNRLLGPTIEQGQRGQALASVAAKADEMHPAKTVTNAFYRRGYPVLVTGRTQGTFPPQRP